MGLRVVSYGGGVQSTSLLVLAAQRKIDFPVFLFANVGDDSEHPATLDFVRNFAIPYGAAHGIEVHEIQKIRRDGTPETLYGVLTREGSRSLRIPVRMPGASEADPATVAVGFSTDEMHRAGRRTDTPYEIPTFPLLDLGLDRNACITVIERAGLPIPHKSSCYFCPFHRPATWAEMRRDEPELFWKSVALEKLLNERRDMLGKDHVYLTRFGKPLDEAIAEAQSTLFGPGSSEGPETCDDGYCWT